jgi:hypothetical protein
VKPQIFGLPELEGIQGVTSQHFGVGKFSAQQSVKTPMFKDS